jgi:hypothetical protein
MGCGPGCTRRGIVLDIELDEDLIEREFGDDLYTSEYSAGVPWRV